MGWGKPFSRAKKSARKAYKKTKKSVSKAVVKTMDVGDKFIKNTQDAGDKFVVNSMDAGDRFLRNTSGMFDPDTAPDPEAVDVVNPATATQSSAGKKKVANSKQDASNFSTTDASKVKQSSLGGYKTDAGLGFAKKKKSKSAGLGV